MQPLPGMAEPGAIGSIYRPVSIPSPIPSLPLQPMRGPHFPMLQRPLG